MDAVIGITIFLMYILFKIAWEGTLLLITMFLFLVTMCFGRPTWVRF